MFTARAEYRLLLRHDNADLRLMEKGEALGLVPTEAAAQVRIKRRRVRETLELLRKRRVGPELLIGRLRRPGARFEDLYDVAPDLRERSLDKSTRQQIVIEARYETYIERQLDQVARLQRLEKWRFPAEFAFDSIPGLRNEAVEKLGRFRPRTLGQAGRIAGVTPADLSILMVTLKARFGATVPE